MAVKDNLSGSKKNGSHGKTTISNNKAIIDTGLSDVTYIVWFIANQGQGMGYDFLTSRRVPASNASWYDNPTKNGGVVTVTGGLVSNANGYDIEWWAVNCPV